jgi:hypothetical protein
VVQNLALRFPLTMSSLSLQGCPAINLDACLSLRACQNLQSLTLASCPGLRDAGVAAIVQSCAALLTLNLADTAISDVSLNAIAGNCDNLEFLRYVWGLARSCLFFSVV